MGSPRVRERPYKKDIPGPMGSFFEPIMTSEVLNDNAVAAAAAVDNDVVVAPAPAAPISIPSSLSVHGDSVACKGDCPIGSDEDEEDEEEEEDTRPAMIGSSSFVPIAALERFFPAVRSL